MVLFRLGHLAKDGGKTGWVETSSEMMVQPRDGPSVARATGLRGKEGRLQDLVAALGTGVTTGGLRFGEGPLSGDAIAFKSLQGSLWAEGRVLSCVAAGSTDSITSDREATGNQLVARRSIPVPGGVQRSWRAGEAAGSMYQEGQAWVTSFSSQFTLEY